MEGALYSTLVTGLLLVAVAAGIAWGRGWRRDRRATRPFTASEAGVAPGRTETSFADLGVDPITGFFAVLAGTAVVGGLAVLSLGQAGEGVLLVAVFGPLVVSYLVGGVYLTARSRGGSTARATAGSAVAVGLLLVAAVTTKLLLGI